MFEDTWHSLSISCSIPWSFKLTAAPLVLPTQSFAVCLPEHRLFQPFSLPLLLCGMAGVPPGPPCGREQWTCSIPRFFCRLQPVSLRWQEGEIQHKCCLLFCVLPPSCSVLVGKVSVEHLILFLKDDCLCGSYVGFVPNSRRDYLIVQYILDVFG